MERVTEQQLSAATEGINKSTAETTDNCKPHNEIDLLMQDYATLVNPAFKSWYCKAAYKVGATKFRELAAIAKEGDKPARYFSFLLKRALQSG